MDKKASREKRKIRVRKKVQGSAARPRLCVFRSTRYIYAQLIDDDEGKVLGAATSKSIDAGSSSMGGKEAAKKVGMEIAKIAKTKSIDSVVFDRNGYLYHGRIAAVCDGAREGGLKV